MRRREAVACGLLLAALAAGCRGGDGDGAGPGRPPTSTPTTPEAASTAPGSDLASVRWQEVELPIECGDVANRAEPVSVVTAQPAPGVQVAVVVTACRAGAGSPPRSVLVYDGADSPTRPRLRQTLWEDGLNRLTSGVVAAAGELASTGGTYSSREVPRCCPDGAFTTRWRWSDAGYVQVSTSAPPAW